MKSQNDIYHGDEHITDKPKKYKVLMSELIHYEVEVDAFDEDEACDKAYDLLQEDEDNEYIINTNQSGFQTDNVKEIT